MVAMLMGVLSFTSNCNDHSTIITILVVTMTMMTMMIMLIWVMMMTATVLVLS